MRRYNVVPLFVACSIAGLVAISCDSLPVPDSKGLGESGSLFISSVSEHRSGFEEEPGHSVELIFDVEVYEDLDHGFSIAIPAGWRRIVTAESEEQAASDLLLGVETGSALNEDASPNLDVQALEPGYAVGFESAQQHDDDQFADYILVEILPGESSGLFAADLSHRRSAVIDGRSAWYDRLEIEHASTGLTDVDLVIYQAELAGVGYTVGLYAIGEHTSESIMAIAFELMLQTFRMDRPPFSIS